MVAARGVPGYAEHTRAIMSITDDIRHYATALDDLPVRLRAFRERAEAEESTTSPMCHARAQARARGAVAEALIVDARARALHASDACAEHVRAIARLLQSPERLYSAQVLARSAMESAGLVRWMLNADPMDLVSRHLGRAREEQDRALSFLKSADVSDPADRERLAQVKADIVAMKERTLGAIKDLAIQPTPIGATALARYGGESTEYDIYSGSTHGRLGSFLETRAMANDDQGNAILFMNLISVAAPAYISSIESLHQFVSGEQLPDDTLREVAESLGLAFEAVRLP